MLFFAGSFSLHLIWFISWQKFNFIWTTDQFNQFIACWQKTTIPTFGTWACYLLVFYSSLAPLFLENLNLDLKKLIRWNTFLSDYQYLLCNLLRTRLSWKCLEMDLFRKHMVWVKTILHLLALKSLFWPVTWVNTAISVEYYNDNKLNLFTKWPIDAEWSITFAIDVFYSLDDGYGVFFLRTYLAFWFVYSNNKKIIW